MSRNMSDTTELRISIMETKKDIEYIKGALNRNLEEHAELKRLIEDFIASAEQKYSSKWVEVSMKSIIAVIVLTVVGAVLALVIKS